VQKIVSEILPASTGLAFSKDARDLLIECCVEFITLISSEANEISEKEAKKTIACDHITRALEQLGFPEYVPAVLEAAAEAKEVQKVRLDKGAVDDVRHRCTRAMLTLSIAYEPQERHRQICSQRAVSGGAAEVAGGAV